MSNHDINVALAKASFAFSSIGVILALKIFCELREVTNGW